MSQSIVQRLAQDRSRAMEKVFTSSAPVQGRELDRAVRLCLALPEEAQLHYASAWDQAMAGQIDDFQRCGDDVLAVVDSHLRILSVVQEWVRAAEQVGQHVGRAEELPRAVDALRSLRSEVVGGWLWPEARTLNEIKAEEGDAEWLELDEAFARIAGVDKETWLKRVEEHKRRKQA